MARRVCPECGHIEGEYTFFCTECGAKTVEDPESVKPQMQPASTPVTTNSRIEDARENDIDNEEINDSYSHDHSSLENHELGKGKNRVNSMIIALASAIGVLAIVVIILAAGKNSHTDMAAVSDVSNIEEKENEAIDNEQYINENVISDEMDDDDYAVIDDDDNAVIDYDEQNWANEDVINENIDVEAQVLEIREKYSFVVENINSGTYTEKVVNNGMSVYTDGTLVKAIVVPKNTAGTGYAEYFYFDEAEKIFFAYYESDDANRLYFLNDVLIRWRYSQNAADAQEAENHDIERNNSEYISWESTVLQDGYYYLEMGSNVGESADYILPDSDSRYLTLSNLKGLSAEECRIARNELYARYGRLFDDEFLQAYFDSKEWYRGTIAPSDFKEDMLNDYEIHNRDLIVQYEQEQGYR